MIRLKIILTFLFSILLAQTPQITSISFVGNEVTKEAILSREVNHPVDAPFDSLMAEQDRIRLINLGLFINVDWYLSPVTQNEAALVFEVTESIRILPALLPLYSDETGWGLLVALSMVNFRGMNQTVSVNGRIGRLSSLRFSFYDPWVYGDHGSLGFGAANEKFNHTFLPVNIHTREISLSTGRYWGYKYRGKLGSSLSNKIIHNSEETPIDTLFYTNTYLSGTIDTRDIYTHPTRGYIFSSTIRYIGDLTNSARSSFYLYNSFSIFKSFWNNNLIVGFNAGADLAFLNTEQIFTRSLGGSYSVRGFGFANGSAYQTQPFRFGSQLMYTSLEVRKKFTLPWNFLSSAGMEVVTFADYGKIEQDISNLAESDGLMGIGFGIRIDFPVIQVIRLDYAWGFYQGEKVHQGFHLGFGQKF